MIGNSTPLSAHMFIQIKKENCPGQTSERKPRFNRKAVMSTERLILLAKSVKRTVKLKNKICQDKSQGHTVKISFRNKIIPALVMFYHWAKRLKRLNE